MKTYIFVFCLISLTTISCGNQSENHLFILSGQSNMAGLNLEISFIPTIEKTLGKEHVTIVKHAVGGQPIRRWYIDPLVKTDERPHLFDSLMQRVQDSVKNKKFDTVSFIWMQGERDAREDIGELYKTSLLGLYSQLSKDLKRKDVNFIIGRISDFDMKNNTYPDWTLIRDIQVDVANSNKRFDWVNTDDLNDGLNKKGDTILNDLHMSVSGYKLLGKRFAQKSIELIRTHN